MKMPSYTSSRFALAISLMAGAILPNQIFAQRFNHAGGQQGSYQQQPQQQQRPAPQQQQSRPQQQAPQQQYRQPQQATVQPQQQSRPNAGYSQPGRSDAGFRNQENRISINGGGQNFGNHDYNRNYNRDNGNVRNDHPVVVERDNRSHRRFDRDNDHMYHTGGYGGLRPYSYHPYQPYYWGPRWHPLGFFLNGLAANAIRLSIGNRYYYYSDGCYYSPYNNGYAVVTPPVGAVVSYLPDGYETVLVGDDTYFYFAGDFYIDNGQGYQMVSAPIGAVVSQVPAGATEINVNGRYLLQYNNSYFEPFTQEGQDYYQVVPFN
jgi:hypothetical protein